MEELNPSYYPATRAAGVAVDYINYKLGSPHRLFELQRVTKASRENIAVSGNKYYVTFVMEDLLNDQGPLDCTADILYPLVEKQAAPQINFKLQKELQNYMEDKDKVFYNKMRSRKEPLVGQQIPDNFGNIEPGMEPVLHLAIAASGYVKWQNSTENTNFKMTMIQSFKQVKKDAGLEFQYNMLIHEMVSQEMMSYHIDVIWDLKNGITEIQII